MEDIEVALNWWQDLSDYKINELIGKYKIKKPIRESSILNVYNSEKPRKVKLLISVEVETTKDIDYIIQCTRRGLYRGYDTEPYYVAEPKKVNIEYIKEVKE